MRGNSALRRKYAAVSAYAGVAMMVAGAVLLFPLAALVAAPGEYRLAPAFLLPGLGSLLGGLVLYRAFRPEEEVLTLQEGSILVLVSWLVASLVGALPFMLAARMDFTHAVFESVSGWTTTGLSVVDVSEASRMVLLLRSTLQLVGGAGFAIIMVATLIGPAGTGVSGAEGRTDQLVPHVRQSARIVLLLYAGYTLAGVAGYALAGMSLFDAVNHSFCAVATGGFSTRAESIGYWDSPAIEAVSLPLMLLGNFNFLTAYLIVQGRFRTAFRSGELRLIAVVLPACCALLLILTARGLYGSLGKAVRVSVFEATSALTGTGFTVTTYRHWNGFGLLIIMMLMVVGGGVCSTSGALKQYRVFLLAKAVWWEIRRALLPQSAVVDEAVWRGEAKYRVSHEHLRQVAVFCCLYLAFLLAGALVLTAYGYPIDEALFEYASAQGTVGLSLGVTAPDSPLGVLWTQIAGMFLGRLEFFVVFIGLARIARDLPSLLPRPQRPSPRRR